MDYYNDYLCQIEGMIGDKTTFASTLEELGKRWFGNDFAGVFALNGNYPLDGRYAIVNTDTQDGPGEHWCAVGKGLEYDSFGRVGILGENGLIATEQDAEQDMSETNCGQRCLAFLLVLDREGIEHALCI